MEGGTEKRIVVRLPTSSELSELAKEENKMQKNTQLPNPQVILCSEHPVEGCQQLPKA